MPEIGCAGPAGGGVRHVVRADDKRDVGAGELGVDLVHLLELRVGHVGLGEQHVHVAGHPAGDGVDGVADLDAARLQHLGERRDLMLRLGRRQPVAGHDDDLGGVGELDRGVVGGDGLHVAAWPGDRGRRVTSAEAADDDVADRPVHRVGHQLGQDAAGGADEGTGDDQRPVADDETRHRHGRAGERVQQRDHDGHVRRRRSASPSRRRISATRRSRQSAGPGLARRSGRRRSQRRSRRAARSARGRRGTSPAPT